MRHSFSAFFICLSVLTFGQTEEVLNAPRALFKVSPQHFAINTIKVGGEFFNKSRSKSYSLYIFGRFDSNNSSQPNYYGDDFYKGLGGEFQYRKYISRLQNYSTRRAKTYLQGIYVSGYIQGAFYENEGEFIYYQYNQLTGQRSNYLVFVDESIGNWGTGFTIGVHRTLWKVLFIDAYIGGGIQWSDVIRISAPGLNYNDYYYYSGITAPDYQGIMPKFGLLLGVSL